MIEMHDQSSLLADITYLILMRLAPDAFVTATTSWDWVLGSPRADVLPRSRAAARARWRAPLALASSSAVCQR